MTSTERDLPEDKLRELLTWLRKRGEPDSGIRYDHRNFDGRGAWVELHGADADFVAKHFHGQGARDLADALTSIRAERDAAVAHERKRAIAAIQWVFSADGTKVERSMADEAINKINDPTFARAIAGEHKP